MISRFFKKKAKPVAAEKKSVKKKTKVSPAPKAKKPIEKPVKKTAVKTPKALLVKKQPVVEEKISTPPISLPPVRQDRMISAEGWQKLILRKLKK